MANELFRFVLVKPAEKVKRAIDLTKDLAVDRSSWKELHAKLNPQSLSQRGIPEVTELESHTQIAEMDKKLPDVSGQEASNVGEVVFRAFGSRIALSQAIGNKAWQQDKRLLASGLLRIHLQGHDVKGQGPPLARFRQLYDLAEQVAEDVQSKMERNHYQLWPLWVKLSKPDGMPSGGPEPVPPVLRQDSQLSDQHIQHIRDLSAALKLLNSPRALDEIEPRADSTWEADENPLRLKPTWASRLPVPVQETLKEMIDEAIMTDYVQVHNKVRQLIRIQNLGHQLEGNQEAFRAGIFSIGRNTVQMTNDWPRTPQVPSTGPVATSTPSQVLPEELPSSVRPSGLGQLTVVRSHLKKYEGTDLGHIHNVLRSEHLTRQTKRLERTETTEVTSEANETEEEKDTQSTERFALSREVSNILHEDASTKFGLSTSAKYGPTVEVKADMSHAENSSSDMAEKVATQFSKDVVSRAASKVVQKLFHSKTVTQIQEFQESYTHEFDNKAGDENVSGLYQWVNKVMHSQMFSLETPRLLFDLYVPEPAQFLMELVSKAPASIPEPPRMDFSARDIHEENYMELAARYGAAGMKAPPALRMSFSKGIVADPKSDKEPGKVSGILEIAIPKDYLAIGFQSGFTFVHNTEPAGQSHFSMVYQASSEALQGGEPIYGTKSQLFGFPPISTSFTIAYSAEYVASFASVVRVHCVRDPQAFEDWQLTCYNSILTAHTAMQASYDRAMAQAAVADATMVSGANSDENMRIIRTELKKCIISMLTQQSFSLFNGIDADPATGSTKVNVPAALFQGQYIAFFEQAFEWEELQWMFYPYYWSRQSTWTKRALFSNVDPVFADFARAGSARVNFGARPGFEEDVMYFLQTGKIWGGGPLSSIHDDDYLDIADEIAAAQGRKGKEAPVGKAWEVSVPTQLVRLRKGSVLPEFESYTDTEIDGVLWRETEETAAQA